MSYFKESVNQTNYIFSKHFMRNEGLVGYSDLVKIFQKSYNNEESNNYQKRSSQTSQWRTEKERGMELILQRQKCMEEAV